MKSMNTMTKEEQLYKLGEDIVSASNEEMLQELQEKLAQELGNCFAAKQYEEIEKSLIKATENQRLDIFETIINEAEIEMENVLFQKDEKNYQSTMLLLPSLLVSKKDRVLSPSIEKLETLMQNKLLEKGFIKNKDNFKLTKLRMSQEEVENLTMQDWWELHRNTVLKEESSQEKNIFKNDMTIDTEDTISLVYYVANIIEGEFEEEILSNFLSNNEEENIWESIGTEVSTPEAKITFIPPDFIQLSLEQAQYSLQLAQLQIFLNTYSEIENVDVGYIKSVEEDKYVVFFFDSEEQVLMNYYQFETGGANVDFVTFLCEEVAIGFKNQNLWHFDEMISEDDLYEWNESEYGVELTELIKTGHTIDLNPYAERFIKESPKGAYLH